MKSKNLLRSFTEYCVLHPEQRFWQALRNWAKQDFIFFGNGPKEDPELTDTFYIE